MGLFGRKMTEYKKNTARGTCNTCVWQIMLPDVCAFVLLTTCIAVNCAVILQKFCISQVELVVAEYMMLGIKTIETAYYVRKLHDNTWNGSTHTIITNYQPLLGSVAGHERAVAFYHMTTDEAGTLLLAWKEDLPDYTVKVSGKICWQKQIQPLP